LYRRWVTSGELTASTISTRTACVTTKTGEFGVAACLIPLVAIL
jgi:hypothetical protein